MNQLNTFNFGGNHTVRTVALDGVPWFLASDVAKALGYRNPNWAVNQHCRAQRKTRTTLPNDPQGPPVNVLIIREGDVWRLVLSSKLPAAREFESWLMDEVLPTLNKTGQYAVNTPPQASQPPAPVPVTRSPIRDGQGQVTLDITALSHANRLIMNALAESLAQAQTAGV